MAVCPRPELPQRPRLPSPALLARTRRGILFSAPMVLAILRGQKRVTRRLDRAWLKLAPGDLLYVQETLVRDDELAAFFVLKGFARRNACKRVAGNCTQRLRKAGRIFHVRAMGGWIAK